MKQIFNPAEKDNMYKEVDYHEKQDNYISGTYCSGGKGCGIGCHSKNPHGGHQELSRRYGIPEQLLYLGNSIFEGLVAPKLSKKWPRKFYTASEQCKDLSQVWPRFGHWLLVNKDHGVINYANNESQEHIEIIAGAVLNSTEESEECIKSTAAARSAAARSDAARYAAHSAAHSADAARYAAHSADAARYAAHSADAARYAARYAAHSAARSVVAKTQSDKLIEIMESIA